MDYSKPYFLTREQFLQIKEDNSPQGSALFKFTKQSKNIEVQRFNNLILLEFGVQKWLTDKAINGCTDSLEKLEYGYDLYSEVINKAKEEHLI